MILSNGEILWNVQNGIWLTQKMLSEIHTKQQVDYYIVTENVLFQNL